MSARYEVARVSDGINLDVLSGAKAEEWDGEGDLEPGERVLVIGDPWASAYAVVGTGDELRQFATRLLAMVTHGDGDTAGDRALDRIGVLLAEVPDIGDLPGYIADELRKTGRDPGDF